MWKIIRTLYHRIRPVRVSGYNNDIDIRSHKGRKFDVCVKGNGNDIHIGKNCLLTNTRILMQGDGMRLIVDDDVRFLGPCRIIMTGNKTILSISRNVGIRGVEFNLNGANVEVGERCMFSYGIILRNHDSHKILSQDGVVLNPPKDIVLGRHVWIGQNATILKGCHIGEDSVIGFGAVVTRSCDPGSVMTGVPARVVKEGITWDY